jgi:hypothetical protein
MPKRVHSRANASGMIFFDLWDKGRRHKIYTGRPNTPENQAWAEKM